MNLEGDSRAFAVIGDRPIRTTAPPASVRKPAALVFALAVGAAVGTAACSGSAETADAPAATATVAAQGAVMEELIGDLETVESKLLDLAGALDDQQYQWAPMEGVRSVREVFMHVAADNYLMPLFAGIPAPEATGITLDYRGTVVPYETRNASRDEIIADLEVSFAHLKQAMRSTDPANYEVQVEAFGNTWTTRELWIQTVTHLHEHLGQSIAYTRSNGVVPPWSRDGM